MEDENDAESQWSQRHWMAQSGGYTCKQCGAYIDPNYLDIHLQWHEKLRRAVDETGTLG